MAGQWPRSRSQEIGTDGRPSVGLRAYFYESGTSTPLTTYSNYTLGSENPAFVETDGYGRWPPVYFDDATDQFYRQRVTTAAGVVLYDDDTVPILGPGDGSEDPPAPIDQNGLMITGDFIASHRTGTRTGFVRANGRTIGSAISGAAERANADTEDLFTFLWGQDSNLTVSGGRGANAAADWAADKTITLPDWRGRVPAGLDDMGNSAAGILTDVTTLGEVGGSEDYTLVATDLPELSGTAAANGSHAHKMFASAEGTGASPTEHAADVESNFGGEKNYQISNSSTTPTLADTSEEDDHTHTVTVNSGTADPISLLQPYIGVTWYIKL